MFSLGRLPGFIEIGFPSDIGKKKTIEKDEQNCLHSDVVFEYGPMKIKIRA